MTILAGDIGGTKTWLALYRDDGAELHRERFDSGAHGDLVSLVRKFVGGERVVAAAFGIAGPIENGVCKATNLPWVVRATDLRAALGGAPVGLVNDFHAVARGIEALSGDQLAVLVDAPADPTGTVAVLGAGTGLGVAVIAGGVMASEGGHVDFAPRDEVEMGLLRFLMGRHPRVSYERVVSGPGLAAIYEYIVEAKLAHTTAATIARLRDGDDAGAVVGEHGSSRVDPACEKALDLFVSLYGAFAGNLALTTLPKGGVFVTGGIAPKIIGAIKSGPFLASFFAKGRMEPLLRSFRVSVVLEPLVGLLGARQVALELR